MSKSFYETCKEYLKKEEIKHDLINILKPFLGAFLNEMYPYILFLVVIILFSFLLMLSILYNILRLKKMIEKIVKNNVFGNPKQLNSGIFNTSKIFTI